MDTGLHTDTRDNNDSAGNLEDPIPDRVVWAQEQADKIRKSLARNSAIRNPTLIHTAPNYYHEMTAFNGYG